MMMKIMTMTIIALQLKNFAKCNTFFSEGPIAKFVYNVSSLLSEIAPYLKLFYPKWIWNDLRISGAISDRIALH